MKNLRIAFAVVLVFGIFLFMHVMHKIVGIDGEERAQAAIVAPAEVKSPPAAERWRTHKSVNALDGKVELAVWNDDLTVRCTPKLAGYVSPTLTNLGHQLRTGVDHNQTVRYRIDGGKLTTGTWDVSDDFADLFIPAGTLHSVMRAKHQLMYEYSPEYVQSEIATVDLSGLEDALNAAGCKV